MEQRGVLLLTVFVTGVFVARAVCQAPTDQKHRSFDVAAIKQNTSIEAPSQFGGPPSRFTATNVPALQFILFAYRLRDFQIEGAPEWLQTDRWDINARAEGDFPPTTIDGPDPRREMLRALLVDRFKLSAHLESRDRPSYALVRAQPVKPLSPRLHPSTVDCVALIAGMRRGQTAATPPVTPDGAPDCSIVMPPGRVSIGTQPMRQLAEALSRIVGRPVVDRTDLTGNYSALLTYTPDAGPRQSGADQPAPDPNGASLFTALEEQLGLKLESTRGLVDVLVIDHVERPTPD